MEKPPIPKEKLSLVLRCYADIQGGVGRAWALPVLKYGGKRWSAGKVSRGLGRDGIALDNNRIKRETLEDLGIGPLGRFIDGAPIAPVKLKPWELLYRGGEGMDRFCSGFEFDRDRWIKSAEPETLFTAHLDFLRAYGISGGIIAGDGEETAALLAAYLRRLSEEEAPGNALILMGKNSLQAYMGQRPPLSGRIRLEAYEDMGGKLKPKNLKWDILILVNPEDVLGESGQPDLYKAISGIKARLRLGICSDASGVLNSRSSNNMKVFFGIRGRMKKLVRYVFRDIREDLPLPRPFPWRPPMRRRPPDPFGGDTAAAGGVAVALAVAGGLAGGAVSGITGSSAGKAASKGVRFIIYHRFRSLPTPKFKEEQQWFHFDGPAVSPSALSAASPPAYTLRRDYELSFEGLNEKQRAFFLYWRGEFRRGKSPETYPAYILLYARELILSMGADPPMENFRELLRLWQSYREREPDLDYRFPQWLIDFAVLYEISGEALPLLLPFAGEGKVPLLRDVYLHKTYIEEERPIVFSDLIRLLDYGGQEGAALYPPERKPRLEEWRERVFTTLEKYLRETYGKNLLSFFYPAISVPHHIQGFAALYDTGDSVYTAEWIEFGEHKPLRDFIKSINAYLDHLFLMEAPSSRTTEAPPLEPVWRELIHRELDIPLPEAVPEPGTRPISLEADRIAQLRGESDEVRDLLRIDEEPPIPAWQEPPASPKAGDTSAAYAAANPWATEKAGGAPPDSLEDFLGGLAETEAQALALIAGQSGPGAGPQKPAPENMIMPELLWDAINEAFRESFGDLLIDTLDGVPVIHAEYTEKIQKYFGKRS